MMTNVIRWRKYWDDDDHDHGEGDEQASQVNGEIAEWNDGHPMMSMALGVREFKV